MPVKTVKTDTITAAEPTASIPATGPAVEGRPAEQPVDVVGEVKPEAAPKPVAPEQVASANVEPAAIAAGSWSVQIASQPSDDSAKSTYQDLARRYGGVIGGRGVNIVKAEIAGKGTFWRVRVPAGSRATTPSGFATTTSRPAATASSRSSACLQQLAIETARLIAAPFSLIAQADRRRSMVAAALHSCRYNSAA